MLSEINYSLTSHYGHLSITDSSFGLRNAKNHTFPTLYSTDTSVKWTIGSVPLASILKRFHCKRIVFAIETACYINLTVGSYCFNRMG